MFSIMIIHSLSDLLDIRNITTLTHLRGRGQMESEEGGVVGGGIGGVFCKLEQKLI